MGFAFLPTLKRLWDSCSLASVRVWAVYIRAGPSLDGKVYTLLLMRIVMEPTLPQLGSRLKTPFCFKLQKVMGEAPV